MTLPIGEIVQGDCLDVMRGWPADCVDMCCTSPPYWGLRDYGVAGQIGLEPTPQEYIARMVAVFEEVRRVLKPSGTMWLNCGDSYAAARSYQVTDSKHISVGNTMPSTVPPGLKPKDLCMIPARLAIALQDAGWWLRSDIIWAKCLSGGATVYARTQKGEMPMMVKDMVRLDPATVKLWDGQKWNQVVSWTATAPRGNEVEIELRNGARIASTADHRWPTKRGLVETSALLAGDVLDSTTLPEPLWPRRAELIPDHIGWFIGLYLAEGSQSDGTIQIAGHTRESERFERVQKIAEAYDGYAAVHGTGGNAATINVNCPALLGIIGAYVSGRVAKDKHLHTRCWKRSNDFLRAVLDGYLSGDGHNANGRWGLGFTCNDALACDLRTMAARLGISVRLRRTVHTLNGRGFPGWSGSLYFDPSRRKQSDFEVVAMRKPRARRYWDIALADDPHTFALACGVLTHNSNPMPESVTDRPTSAHEHIFLLAKSGDATCWRHSETLQWVLWPAPKPTPDYRWKHRDSGDIVKSEPIPDYRWTDPNRTAPESSFERDGWKRINLWRRYDAWDSFDYFYDAAAIAEPAKQVSLDRLGRGISDTHKLVDGQPGQTIQGVHKPRLNVKFGGNNRCPDTRLQSGKNWEPPAEATVNSRNVWTIATKPFSQAHFATFPPELPRRCILAGCPQGGIVLDPFFGSGTVGMVAQQIGRQFVGIELNPEYCAIARQRTAQKGLALEVTE